MPLYTVFEVQEETRVRRWVRHVEADSEDKALEKAQGGETDAIDWGTAGEEAYSGSGWAVAAGDDRSDGKAWDAAIENMQENL